MDIKDGINQNNRERHLIDGRHFQIDELSLHDLICYTKDFAAKIKFYNLKNRHDGYWDALLNADEIMVISEICVLNVKAYENEFIRNRNPNFEKSDQYLTRQIKLILKLAGFMNSWFVQLSRPEAWQAESIVKEIDYLIRGRLSEGFQFVKALAQKIRTRQPELWEEVNFEGFDTIWNTSGKDPESKSRDENYTRLKKIFYDFNNAVYSLKRSGLNYFNASLTNRQHAPYVSLLVAFLKLYQDARENLNAFTERYLRFYYRDVLNVMPKTYRKDHAVLLFDLKEGMEEYEIKKGTRFLGGKDETNKNLIYTADNDLLINKAKTGRLLTLYLEKNELIWPRFDCTNILKHEIPAVEIEMYQPENKDKWPLFGGPSGKPAKHAETGFAVSDVNLLLREGYREVRIEMCFTKDSFNSFYDRVNRVKEDHTVSEVFIKLFRRIFNLYLSVEEGWHKIDKYIMNSSLIDEALPPDSLSISFHLAAEDPAITPVSPDIHGEGFRKGIPAIKFLLNNESCLFPYSLMRDLEIEKITTTAHVKWIKNILCMNEHGRVDVTLPFHPFGAIPGANSAFIIGNYEMSQKNITNLNLHIQWNNLPKGRNGLREYFKAYDADVGISDYKCKISFLNNGNWLPKETDPQKTINLFASDTEGNPGYPEKISDSSVFQNIDTNHFQTDSRITNPLQFQYDNYATGGFVRFSLTDPPFAFGHADYRRKITEITMANASAKVKKTMPEPPFSPVAEYMTLGYTSRSSLNFSNAGSAGKKKTEGFCHLHPWGYEDLSPDTHHVKRKLLPDYPFQGNLFIGLHNIKPAMTVSFFFKLLDDSIPSGADEEPPEIAWACLSSNEWKNLPEENLISDSTRGFLQSGIIVIRIPENINRQNTIFSNDLHWIKVSTRGRPGTFSSMVNLFTQAVQVTWENRENSLSHLENPLPAMTIANPESDLHGIKTILQPEKSFNGKPAENTKHTKLRVSERLKHKNRAVTPWDYERLVLENFPDIYKVKCMPDMSSEKKINPGHVLILVIKRTDPENFRIDFEPLVNKARLYKIKSFLSEMAPECANIEVRNPLFERVQVRCAVKIKAGLDAGCFLTRLNEELIHFLTPWQTDGQNEPGFGKVIKCTDVLSFIQSPDYIEFATDFSLLQVTCTETENYGLFDSADRTLKQKQENVRLVPKPGINQKTIIPSCPWGVLISAEKHAITAINKTNEIEPVKTGINELELGENFVII